MTVVESAKLVNAKFVEEVAVGVHKGAIWIYIEAILVVDAPSWVASCFWVRLRDYSFQLGSGVMHNSGGRTSVVHVLSGILAAPLKLPVAPFWLFKGRFLFVLRFVL